MMGGIIFISVIVLGGAWIFVTFMQSAAKERLSEAKAVQAKLTTTEEAVKIEKDINERKLKLTEHENGTDDESEE